MVLQNEKYMANIDRDKKRKERQGLEKLATQQRGVSVLNAKFKSIAESHKVGENPHAHQQSEVNV
jgi:hypothetical protein